MISWHFTTPFPSIKKLKTFASFNQGEGGCEKKVKKLSGGLFNCAKSLEKRDTLKRPQVRDDSWGGIFSPPQLCHK